MLLMVDDNLPMRKAAKSHPGVASESRGSRTHKAHCAIEPSPDPNYIAPNPTRENPSRSQPPPTSLASSRLLHNPLSQWLASSRNTPPEVSICSREFYGVSLTRCVQYARHTTRNSPCSGNQQP